MKILVTGPTGFIGSALIAELLELPLLNISITAAGRSEEIISDKFSGSVDFRFLELNSISNLELDLTDIDIIVHTAARVHILKEISENSHLDFKKINTDATIELAMMASQAGVKRLIFLSTIKVNGEYSKKGMPFSISSCEKPTDSYAISKYKAEIELQNIAKNTNLEIVIIRTPLVYGSGVKGNFNLLMKLILSKMPIPFASIVANKRSLIGIDNLVNFIIECIVNPRAKNQTFLVSDGQDLSTFELLVKLGKALDKPVYAFKCPIILLKYGFKILGKSAMSKRLLCSLEIDIEDTCQKLNWRPPHTVDFCLAKLKKAD